MNVSTQHQHSRARDGKVVMAALLAACVTATALSVAAIGMGGRALTADTDSANRASAQATVVTPGASARSSSLQPPLAWRLNSPRPTVIEEANANPAPVTDKFSARVRSIDERAILRAFEGAPPTIPHSIADLGVATCQVCHAQGLVTGEKVARMIAHTSLTNCTQCHVEAASPMLDPNSSPLSTFVGLRASGYGGTRAWTGAPPVMPHSTFMRTNCVSCHGEHGYDGWRPDHLSRSNCIQCHAPAAQFDQLSPAFGVADTADGATAVAPR